jgi:hypothetical protein
VKRGRFFSSLVPVEIKLGVTRCPPPSTSSSDIPNGDLPVARQKTSGKASCMRRIQMHFMAPWLEIRVNRTERHVPARLRTSRMERKDAIERIFSSEPFIMSFMTCDFLGVLVRFDAIFPGLGTIIIYIMS